MRSRTGQDGPLCCRWWNSEPGYGFRKMQTGSRVLLWSMGGAVNASGLSELFGVRCPPADVLHDGHTIVFNCL